MEVIYPNVQVALQVRPNNVIIKDTEGDVLQNIKSKGYSNEIALSKNKNKLGRCIHV